jgi:hypothetical protein
VGRWKATGAHFLSCGLLFSVTCLPLAAQVQVPRDVMTPPGIRYGKWAAAAVAVGFTAMGIRTHQEADDDFRALADYCKAQGACALSTDGRYTDPVAEARYRDIVRGDRTARAWLISGQTAIVGSAILFVLELKRERGPRNIPYSGLVIEPGAFGTRIGLRLPIAPHRPRR